MRYPASEKLEIIRTVEAPHLPTRQTLKMLSIPSSTYYDWYARWSDGGIDALADRSPRPGSVWNRIPDDVREDVVDYALEHEDLTPGNWRSNTPMRSGTLSRNPPCTASSAPRI
jgi:putative transposase